ncbi:MAG: rubrerythrin family protein [Candidatus Aminicenantales bacterium]
MKKNVEENLKTAFAGESQAHLKYQAFADKAESDKLPNVARLFRANSFSEQRHASNHLQTLGGVGKTLDNLKAALEGETYEVTKMYPEFIRVADEQKEKEAAMMNRRAMAAEKVHASLYQKAIMGLEKGTDLDTTPIHVCGVCGFTVEGEAPDKCPICGAPKAMFKRF